MYKKSFYITEPIGNNAFSYEKRPNKSIYIPSLIEINDLEQIEIGDNISFEDFDFDDKLSTNYGLKNFYKIKWEGKYIYLFDNHNHAFYFWYLARNQGIIGDNNTLIHIDEHADTRDNNKHLLKPDSFDLQKVFDFTNNVLNVGDYIIPAKEEGIIGEIIQIRNDSNLLDYINHHILTQNSPHPNHLPRGDGIGQLFVASSLPLGETEGGLVLDDVKGGDFILNLDLDFFQPDLDYIDYELKKKVILDVSKKASVITVSTSPFFINQELAIKVFKDIFGL